MTKYKPTSTEVIAAVEILHPLIFRPVTAGTPGPADVYEAVEAALIAAWNAETPE